MIDVFFGDNGQKIEHATARNKVLVNQKERECKGETAQYYLNLGKVVVVGNPAEVYEPEKGRSFARKLTIFTADDRILLETR